MAKAKEKKEIKGKKMAYLYRESIASFDDAVSL